MKKYFLMVFMLFTTLCFATPTVNDIQQAIAQHNAPLVEQLSLEVLQAHPNSAKAHYFLGEAYYHENRIGEAHNQLMIAQGLDNNLSFTNNTNMFYHLLNATVQQQANAGQPIVNKQTNGAIWYWLLGFILLSAIGVTILARFKNKQKEEAESLERMNILRDDTISKTNTHFISDNIDASRPILNVRNTSSDSYRVPLSSSPAPVVNNYYNNGGSNSHSLSGMGTFATGMAAGYIADELLSNRHHDNDRYESSRYDDAPTYASSSNNDNNSWDVGSGGQTWDDDSRKTSSSSWDDSSSSSSSSPWSSDSSSSSSWDSSSSSSDWGSSSTSDSSW